MLPVKNLSRTATRGILLYRGGRRGIVTISDWKWLTGSGGLKAIPPVIYKRRRFPPKIIAYVMPKMQIRANHPLRPVDRSRVHVRTDWSHR